MTLCEMYFQLPKTMLLHSQGFEPIPVHVGCVVDKNGTGIEFSYSPFVSLVIVIPPLLHTHSFINC